MGVETEEQGTKKHLWTLYDVRWDFTTNLCGSVPADENMVKAWIDARKPKVQPPSGKSIEEVQTEVLEHLALPEEDLEQKSMLTFQRNNGNLVLRAGTIRAHMKDCARVLSSLFVGKVKGERSLAVRIVNGCYVDESTYWIPIQRPDGTLVSEQDGYKDKAVHAQGPRGPQNCLKRFAFVNPASAEFTIKVLGSCIPETDLHHLFRYGGVHGYGGERGDGEGKYVYKLTKKGFED